MDPQSPWNVLANIPNISYYDVIVLYDNIRNSLFAIKHKLGLFKYSFDTDSWTKYQIKSSLKKSLIRCSSYHAAVINCKTNTIYLFNASYSIMTKFQIMNNNKSIMELHQMPTDITADSQAIIIKDECHIIGGFNNNKHIKYNTKTQKYQILHNFEKLFNFRHLLNHKLIKIQNKLLIFGGYDGDKYLDTVYQYDIIRNKWNKLNCKMPKRLSDFGCTPILNGQYVLLFGGIGECNRYQDNIYFYSVRDQRFKTSNIKCPEIGEYQAITVNNEKDTLTTFGFVRSKWKECGLSDDLFPPQYLITIICGYYLNEFVHLFDTDNGNHYRINVFDIDY